MNAVTQAGTSGMTLEGWCVLAMGALFGMFLVCVWWELRAALRRVGRDEKILQRAAIRFETEAAFGREIARGRASERVQSLRATRAEQAASLSQAAPMAALNAPAAHADETASDMGMESVGRILQRLAQAAPEVEDEVPAFTRPALNMVRGGKTSQVAAGAKVQQDDETVGASEENLNGTAKVAAARRGRGQSAAQGGSSRARNGVKSNAIGGNSIGAGAMVASR